MENTWNSMRWRAIHNGIRGQFNFPCLKYHRFGAKIQFPQFRPFAMAWNLYRMHTNNGSTAFSSLGSVFNRVDFINSSNKIRIRCWARPNNNNYYSIYLFKLLDEAHFIFIPYFVLMQMRPSPTDEPTGTFHTLSALISRATVALPRYLHPTKQ